MLSFVSNDYLGMSQNKETIEAGIEALKKYGTGVCASPIIGGYLDIHRVLEEELAQHFGFEAALVFSSGYGANSGTVSALLGKEDLAIIDSAVHTSIMDGLRGTNVKLIPHNDLEKYEFILKREQSNYNTKMVIVDGVYSQDGDIGKIPEIKTLCEKYGALLLVDDAHGVGVIGENGKGVLEHFNMLGKVDLLTGTFSKSFGAVGGFVVGSQKMIQYLRYYANTTVFSAAIVPQVTCSVLKALSIMQTRPDIREKLWRNTNYLKERLIAEGYEIGDTASPIIPVKIRNDHKAKEVTRLLFQHGIYVIGIVYPAVSMKDARIRLAVTASHEIDQLDQLIDHLAIINQQIPIKIKYK